MTQHLKSHKLLLTLTIILSTVVALGTVFIAILLEQILDLAVGGDMGGFGRLLLFSAAYFALLVLFAYLYALSSKYLVNMVIQSMRERAFAGVISRHYADFRKQGSADYLSALTNDINIIEASYLTPLLTIIKSAVSFAAAVVVMFYFDVIIAIATMTAILLMFVVPGLFGSLIQKRQEKYSHSLSDFTAHAKDILAGYEVVKSYGMVDYILMRFKKSNEAAISAKYGVDKIMAVTESLSMILGVFVQIGAMFLAAYFIITGRISVGALLGITQATAMLVGPLSAIFQGLPQLKGARPIIARLDALSGQENVATGVKAPVFEQGITAENLSFSYDGENAILRDASLALHKGAKYAIVGKSGCGKTTLARLLCGYYYDYRGQIRYDSADLKELDYDGIVGLSSTIHQGVYMFNESIYDNICLHREYSDVELEKALDISGVSGFVHGLPEGLCTLVEENGANLSGGQKQRIAVARAIIQGKPLLVLDEGTSAIDMQTAHEIESSLLNIDDLTLVTITHNLQEDNLMRYGQIIFMEDGAVAEVGTYGELMERGGGFSGFTRLGEGA